MFDVYIHLNVVFIVPHRDINFKYILANFDIFAFFNIKLILF